MSYPPDAYGEGSDSAPTIPLINGQANVDEYPPDLGDASRNPGSPGKVSDEEEVEIDLIKRYEDFTTVGTFSHWRIQE